MKLLALDFETWGKEPAYALEPFRLKDGSAWITTYAAAVLGADGLPRVTGGHRPTRERMRQLLVTCAEQGLRIVCWNSVFDVAWLIALGLWDEVLACKWLDAMLLYKHLTIEPRYIPHHQVPGYGLKPAVAKYYPDEAGYEADIDFGTEDPEELKKLLTYNKNDARHTLNLAAKFLAEMTPEQKRAALIEADAIPLVAETYIRGITANGVKAQALSDQLTREANLAFVTLKMDTGAVTPEVLASPTKLRSLLFETWGLPIQGYTEPSKTYPGGQPSTDKEALGRLGLIDPRANLVHTYREARNGKTKYCTATLKSLAHNGDGCVRPGHKILGTYTGRMTVSSKQGKGVAEVQTGIALHQWKRGKEYRELLEAPEGHDLIEADFAGQEFKWMAINSRDPTMLGLCRPGEDPHSFMASRIENLNYRNLMARFAASEPAAKNSRYLGKVANLSLQYRTGWQTLMLVAWRDYKVVLTPIEARAIWSTYRTTYLEVPEYWKKAIYIAQMAGYAETAAGRRVQLGTGDLWTGDTKWSRESTAINFPIQGVGADQKYLALKVLRDYLPKVNGRFYYELHDGMFVIVPCDKSLKAAHDIKYLLSNLPYKKAWGKDFPIALPVDAKIGKSWGSLKEIA